MHYVGRLAESGEVFIDTRQESPTQEPEELVAGRGECALPGGLGPSLCSTTCCV